MTNNPFSIMFGKNPVVTISRTDEKQLIINTFSSEVITNQAYLITAIRGAGKTVFMMEISDYFKGKKNWITIELNITTDMQLGLLAKLNTVASNFIKSLNFNLALFDIVTIGCNLENKITDPETAIIKILEHLNKQNIRVLVTIDEVNKNENMKVFASMYQILVRNNLPIFLLMTGLYENIKNLQDDKSLTFLYRTPKIKLESLNLTLISNKYKEIFSIDELESKKMAKLTLGYAFAFQVLGYLTYEHNGNYKEILSEYRAYLEDYSYNKIWRVLSSKDKDILYAIAKSKTNKVSEIISIANISNNSLNPYRKRLMDKGVVTTKERGKLLFTLPLFKDYVLDNFFYNE